MMNLLCRHAVVACAAQLSARAVSNHRLPVRITLKGRSYGTSLARAFSQLDSYNTFERQCAVKDGLTPLEAALRWAALLLAVACLQLGNPGAADALDLASASEDKLLGVVRLLETRTDSALTAIRGAASALMSPASAADTAAQRAAAEALVNEVYDVVYRNYEDARGAGFEASKWSSVRDQALAKPLPYLAAAHSAVREMLSYLRDPYSRFLSPQEFGAMMKYDVSGVGVNLGTLEDLRAKTDLVPARPAVSSAPESSASGGVWVVGIIRNSPAEVAGMRQGDEIVAVDDAALTGQSPFQVASLLQAQADDNSPDQAGSLGADSRSKEILLRVRRLDGTEGTVRVVRPDTPKSPSPVASRLEGDVGVIKLSSFTAKAQRDVAAAVQSLQAAGAQRLVLDLRGNRGGLVSEGIEVARLFLDGDALIVRTEGRARSSAAPITAPGPALTTAPLAVLVDDHTASASEILAGALQDNCRAVLVGKRTYGKGLIQSVYELSDGSGLVLTVGKYLTPAGTDIDWEGLHPDFRSMPAPQAAGEAVAACRLRRG